MHADLERLIHLQQLETDAEAARRLVADEPVRHQELDARLAAARESLERERQNLVANQVARRELEKELALHQGRLSKYKDQLMAVKTNREYQAMLKEIETEQHEVQVHEERMLERMIEFDDVTAEVKKAETAFAQVTRAIESERADLSGQIAAASASLAAIAAERAVVVAQLPRTLVETFDKLIAHRHGVAVSAVRDGLCATCQVRLRQQVHNDLRRNDSIVQCDSCRRILYYVAPQIPS